MRATLSLAAAVTHVAGRPARTHVLGPKGGAFLVARSDPNTFRIDIDLDHARREGERVRDMLAALRRRHDLARYEYTTVVRILPGGDTFAQPILTLGNRFAD